MGGGGLCGLRWRVKRLFCILGGKNEKKDVVALQFELCRPSCQVLRVGKC